MIFVVEVLVALRSPLPISRKDKALLQIVLPLGSFIVFMFLPSGKKIFMITSLAFSSIYHAFKLMQDWSKKIIEKYTPKPQSIESESPQKMSVDAKQPGRPEDPVSNS